MKPDNLLFGSNAIASYLKMHRANFFYLKKHCRGTKYPCPTIRRRVGKPPGRSTLVVSKEEISLWNWQIREARIIKE